MMKLNRRTFFQAAALLPAAVLQSTVLQSKGRAIPAQAVAPAPVEIDLTEPGAVAYIGRGATDLFVQLEELAPADLGEPSGASLRIGGLGEDVSLSASIGGVLQRAGYRSHHLIGWLGERSVAAIASVNPLNPEDGFAISMTDAQNPDGWSSVRLILFAGEDPKLHLYLAAHCLGVLRGDPLLKLFDYLRKRSALGGGVQ